MHNKEEFHWTKCNQFCVTRHMQVIRTITKPWLKCKEQIYFMTSVTGGSQSSIQEETQEREHHLWFPLCSVTSELPPLSPNRELSCVPQSAPKSLQTLMLSLHRYFTSQNRQRTKSSGCDVWGFPQGYFLDLVIESCKVT